MELIAVAFIGSFALVFASFAAYVRVQIFGADLDRIHRFAPERLPRPKSPLRTSMCPEDAESERLRPAA